MSNWNERTLLLIGEENYKKLEKAHVLVVGLGGVGAYAAEMICRAGVGEMTIVDADVISPSNRNRQLPALESTHGLLKSDVMQSRLLDINPKIKLNVIAKYIKDEETDILLDSAKFDFVVDCIDTLAPKVNLIKKTLDRKIPLVSSMGAGAKTDPTKIEIKDISKSHHCPLAHMLRKRLGKLGIKKGFQVVFSSELARPEAVILVENEQNKKSTVGTISYMPPLFGCHCASVVIRGLLGEIEIRKED
ncbi:tRNA threonylcarbamoyladenosine dehydratase [Acetobacteroides hydrogenigenes]|uniref:tRNA A37 threonylcarbamoyladenosine dehydratase n=1 Tax=Acetobacteroides hydrogenigenes TaxID=979970 RepID=A0A4R2ET96_9BACT|nr:tRNA threonylcarbamoyladenosine dehydratase [Acetobacteroides hydrogenigenes]TCN70682.1 tRNA A37 threonylcarbamoyladenosine dehydratase [Acetobacteroides hydrogenigenes]